MPNNYQQQIDEVLQHRMSRAEFMKFTGAALIGLIGITGLLRNLHQSVTLPSLRKQSTGYGRSAYGN